MGTVEAPPVQRDRGARRAAGPIGTALVVGAATITLAVRSPHVTGSYGVCPSIALFGIWCPACGGLRAVHDLAHADLAGAWAHNPLFVLAVPLLVAAWVRWLGVSLGWWRPGPVPAWSAWVLLGVMAAFTVLRNVPGLEFLAPPP